MQIQENKSGNPANPESPESPENQYLKLIQKILNTGNVEHTRNGETNSLFGETMRFSLRNDTLPMITTKKVSFKNILEELLWFIRGKTDNALLLGKGVRIWNENASRAALDSRGLPYEENDLGPIYGHQWRHFNAAYTTCKEDYKGKGVDQLQMIVNALKDPIERYSRRLVMSAWNPCQLDEMALPPCHIMVQFNVVRGEVLWDKNYGEIIERDKLSCILYQRSADVGLGMPYNITSYSLLTHLLAHHCDMVADKFIYMLGNVHIYSEHMDGLQKQVQRVPYPFPLIKIPLKILIGNGNMRKKNEKMKN
jgi:thymidylate synthase